MGRGADFIDGGIGTDTVDYSSRTAAIVVKLDGKANDGEAGEHDFVVGVTNETLIGGSGNDRLDATGDPSVHLLQGNAGNDTLIGGQNRDMIDGAAGNDSLVGNENADSLTGVLATMLWPAVSAPTRSEAATALIASITPA